MTGYRQQEPGIGLIKCPVLVDHYTTPLANPHGMGKAEQIAKAMMDQWKWVKSALFAIRAAAFGRYSPPLTRWWGTPR